MQYRWDVFGSEALLIALALASSTNKICPLEAYDTPPTWDGSGFNDELAALFLPMDGVDVWGNNWSNYRQKARTAQLLYYSGHKYGELGLFGLSAAEIPEPWAVAADQVYQSFGLGGHNKDGPNDGLELLGYPVAVPHYAAMVSTEAPAETDKMFQYLMSNGIFTPLNNVESLGVDSDDVLRFNGLKGSWNLSLQALGAARALSKGDYLPHRALKNNAFLYNGYSKVFTPAPSSAKDILRCNPSMTDAATVSPEYVLVDDYAGISHPDRQWFYTRIGTDRGIMGTGDYTVELGGGAADVTVSGGGSSSSGGGCFLSPILNN